MRIDHRKLLARRGVSGEASTATASSIAAALLLAIAGCSDGGSGDGAHTPTATADALNGTSTNAAAGELTSARISELRPQVERLCGACHATPLPGSFPKDAWYDEVEQGYTFFYEYQSARANLHDLKPPPMQDVVAWFRTQAPQTIGLKEVAGRVDDPVRFEAAPFAPADDGATPTVSSILRRSTDDAESLLLTDMSSGAVDLVRLSGERTAVERLTTVEHPAHIEVVDLDVDGRDDYLVADLGSFLPADHKDGRLLWLRPNPDGDGFDPVVLLSNVGRVADAQAADFDADGDLDLVVAEFGWRKSGAIHLLEQTGSDDGVPQFAPRTIDNRHGTIHVPIVDLNGDGRPDFVALISQEHEIIEAFLNNGDGTFEIRTIYDARDPSYGSSGIQLADLDADGDVDVLFTNGDSLDSHYLKPSHSVQWLENTGGFPFEHHHLADLPGVYRAVAEDLDGDGDLDVAACAYIPESHIRSHRDQKLEYDSLIWMEQTEPGEFVRHRLQQTNRTGSLALVAGDFNRDGRVDLATGGFGAPGAKGEPRFTIWWNRGP